MAWTTPKTWVTGETVTAAMLNTHLRDNLLETSAATVTTAGDLSYADAANSMGSRLAIGAAGTVLVSTGSAPVWRVTTGMTGDASYAGFTNTAFASLNGLTPAGSGTNVTVSLTTGTQAFVWWGARNVSNATAGARVVLSYAVSGATTIASSANIGTDDESSAANDINSPGRAHFVTLTGGTNNFTVQALVTAGTGTISVPYLAVMGL